MVCKIIFHIRKAGCGGRRFFIAPKKPTDGEKRQRSEEIIKVGLFGEIRGNENGKRKRAYEVEEDADAELKRVVVVPKGILPQDLRSFFGGEECSAEWI